MKEFLKYLACVATIGAVAYSVLLCATLDQYRESAPLSAANGCTAALFGNSVGETAWNPAVLENVDNRCLGGTTLYWMRGGIIEYLRNNDQVKVVFISWDPLTYTLGSNEAHQSAGIPFLKAIFPWISLDLRSLYPLGIKQWIRCLIGTNVVVDKRDAWHYGYVSLNRNNIDSGQWSRAWYQAEYPEPARLPLAEAEVTHSLNLGALRDIIAYCHKRGIKVVLVSMPMYGLEQWVDFSGYYEFLDTLDESVEVADYMNFAMPDKTYYGDVQHLNRLGSDYFCRHLRENGIQSLPVKEYLRETKGKHQGNGQG